MRLLLLIINMAMCLMICHAQFNDNFNDGEIHNNPEWIGDTSNFIVNTALELMQKAPSISDTSILYTKSRAVSNSEWQFNFRLDFNPSSSNFSRIYLMSTSIKQSSQRHGYYIKIGGSEDEVSLYYQNKQNHKLIIDGLEKRLNMNPASGQIRVIRDSIGKWELYVDLGSGPIKEGEAIDNSLIYSTYFGIFNKYTSTRSDKFFFDNFYITGQPFTDSIPPKIIDHQLLTERSISIEFSEMLDRTSLANHQNYTLVSSLQQPSESIVDSGNTGIILKFNAAFSPNQQEGLIVDSIIDTAGNCLLKDTIWFINTVYHTAEYGDVMFNEIMFDPEPSVNLPEAEYLELFNSTNLNIDLNGWKLSDLTDTVDLREIILSPKEYIIVGDQQDSTLFGAFGRFIGLHSFLTLNNSLDALILYDSSWNIIDSVTYRKAWIDEKEKQNGGWSLERNTDVTLCKSSYYWEVSIDANGGTPGTPNSVHYDSLDNPSRIIKSIHYRIQDSLIISIGNPIDTSQLKSNVIVKVDGKAIDYNFTVLTDSTLLFIPTHPLYEGQHSISFQGIHNCLGQLLPLVDIHLPITQYPLEQNLIINEILFDPVDMGSDFVELFNSGSEIIDLYYYSLVELEADSIVQLFPITMQQQILPPGGYIVISPDSNDIKRNFPMSPTGVHIQNKIPAMNNESGNIGLMALGTLKEQLNYSEDMHFSLLTNREGVTLERIDPFVTVQKTDNWHSASERSGYGTPGLANSQLNGANHSNEKFNISPDVISPDNDGIDDYLTITYNLDKQGYRANIGVYNRYGSEVFEICNSYQLGMRGKINWDGINKRGERPYVGIYFLLIELYHLSGEHIVERKPFVVALPLK